MPSSLRDHWTTTTSRRGMAFRRRCALHTERPILVVPAGPSARFGRCVAIAWRDDGRTVKGGGFLALRFLAAAEQFHLLGQGCAKERHDHRFPRASPGPQHQCQPKTADWRRTFRTNAA